MLQAPTLSPGLVRKPPAPADLLVLQGIGLRRLYLDPLIENPQAINGRLSRDDVRILPLLRSAATVRGLEFPQHVRDYYETMMKRTGFEPLPVI